MPPEKRDSSYLFDMLDAARFIVASVQNKSFAQYAEDRGLRCIIERELETIDEATCHISPTLKDAHPEIPWRKIINQCHVLAHEHGEIEHEKIWEVATIHVPELIRFLETLVPPPPADDC